MGCPSGSPKESEVVVGREHYESAVSGPGFARFNGKEPLTGHGNVYPVR